MVASREDLGRIMGGCREYHGRKVGRWYWFDRVFVLVCRDMVHICQKVQNGL
jgi:hypothetical protein